MEEVEKTIDDEKVKNERLGSTVFTQEQYLLSANRAKKEKTQEVDELNTKLKAVEKERDDLKKEARIIDIAKKDAANKQFIQEQRKKKIELLQSRI